MGDKGPPHTHNGRCMAAEFIGGGRRRYSDPCHQDGVYASGHRRARTEVMNTNQLIIVIGAALLAAVVVVWFLRSM
jgi:hypothetical protein